MPIYQYSCIRCGPFEKLLSIGARGGSMCCPKCDAHCVRDVVSPYVAVMPASKRQAHARNEESAHAPVRHQCAPASKPYPENLKPSRGRPWMVGH